MGREDDADARRGAGLALSAGEQCGKYRAIKLIGEGGMGEVWEAEDEYLGRRVALKVIRRARAGVPAFSLGQRKEARVLAQLDHPNVVRVHDAGVTVDGILYIAMERIEGVSLAALIDTLGAQEVLDALSLAVQIADALNAAHHLRLVHRDLKPENVLVTRNGVAKVVDFGVAKRERGGGRKGAATTSDVFEEAGTLYYMAPEQVLRQGASRASDIYAFGLIIYEMLTGSYAFCDEDGKFPPKEQAARRHVEHTPPPLSEVIADFDAPVLEDLVQRMLSKAPADRPDAAEVRDVLGAEYARLAAELPERRGKLERAGGKRRPPQPTHVPRPMPGVEKVQAAGAGRADLRTATVPEGFRPPTPEQALPFGVAPARSGRWPRTEPMLRAGVGTGSARHRAWPRHRAWLRQ